MPARSLLTLCSALTLLALTSGCSDSSSGSSPSLAPLPDRTETTFIEGRYVARGAEEQYIEDTHTGLVWKRCVEGQTWDQGGQICVGRAASLTLDQAGGDEIINEQITGFMLPSRDQLLSLVACPGEALTAESIGRGVCQNPPSNSNPTLATAVFPDTPALTHWTTTCMSSACTTYYGVNFGDGSLSEYNAPSSRYAVRRVRAL
ncbi:DUF1566 domain-containing protein [Marinospirillum sp. MEB164]|uniref:DUF1566 domain-containing protein n=1 Tax=Marinospirillum alkalitolerans TaxID=3123374 RepID=A0ABW8PUY3_9GAMM